MTRWMSGAFYSGNWASRCKRVSKRKGPQTGGPFLYLITQPKIITQQKSTRKENLANVQRLCQPEAKTALGHKSHFFFAGSISCGSSAGCPSRRANGHAVTSASQCAQQCASTRPPADECKVALLITAATYKHTVGLQWDCLAIQRDGRKGDAQITCIPQMP